jgi:hypothetical protein
LSRILFDEEKRSLPMTARAPTFIIALLVLAALVLGGWFWLAESEEDRLAAWLTEIAETLPERSDQAYLDLVDLERYGFRLDQRGIRSNFGKGEQTRFLTVVGAITPMIRGSVIRVMDLKVSIDGELAEADMVVSYDKGSSQGGMIKAARVRITGRLMRDAAGWRIHALSAQPATNPLQSLF